MITLPSWLVYLSSVLTIAIVAALIAASFELVRTRDRLKVLAQQLAAADAATEQWRHRAETLMDAHLVRAGIPPVMSALQTPAAKGDPLVAAVTALGVREIDSSKARERARVRPAPSQLLAE